MTSQHPFAFGGDKHRRSLVLRETVVALFTPLRTSAIALLPSFTESEWSRNLMWLDASGLALYVIHELEQCNRVDLLPPFLVARLQQNLADNRERTAWLFDEAIAINRDLRIAGIRFANLKGFALGPESVPDAALRCQLDLDFVIAAQDAARAREVLGKHGYQRHAVEKNTWEFKAGSSSLPSVGDLYKPRPQRSVELHLASDLKPVGEQASLFWQQLARAEMRTLRGRLLPALSAEDVFINQCTHLFGHFCSEFTRSSWGLELARHIRARCNDSAFWLRVAELIEPLPEIVTAVGVSLLAVEDLYCVSAPARFRLWAVGRLPAPLQLWAHHYGRAALLSDFPGSKFHLLLQDVLTSGPATSPQHKRRRLLPRRLPPMITQAPTAETIRSRMKRYRAQISFLRFRFRFHCTQGLRLLIERRRWRELASCKGMTFRQPAHDNPALPRS